jgi:choline dehydrogenase-like flavoprotein
VAERVDVCIVGSGFGGSISAFRLAELYRAAGVDPRRILVLERGRPIGGLCVRPREPLPDPEEALSHILAIRADERAWLERANFFPHDRALTPQALGLLPGRVGNYDR